VSGAEEIRVEVEKKCALGLVGGDRGTIVLKARDAVSPPSPRCSGVEETGVLIPIRSNLQIKALTLVSNFLRVDLLQSSQRQDIGG